MKKIIAGGIALVISGFVAFYIFAVIVLITMFGGRTTPFVLLVALNLFVCALLGYGIYNGVLWLIGDD
jgi:glucan phosphoethanolaminetransferase (alkaline phosphatase superfamily)